MNSDDGFVVLRLEPPSVCTARKSLSCFFAKQMHASCVFDQSQPPSAGPTSGNGTFGTTRICDADAPEGESVISARTVR